MVNVKITADEFELLNLYHSLDQKHRQAARIILDSFLKAQQEEPRPGDIIPFPVAKRG